MCLVCMCMCEHMCVMCVKELFDEKFGMFIYNKDTHYFWFNPDSLESMV